MEHKWRTIENVGFCLSVVVVLLGVTWGVVWAKVQNEPMYYTGIDTSGRPFCQSRDPQRPCPLYESKTAASEYTIK